MLETKRKQTPARLEALFTSSQSSPFVPSWTGGSRFLASDCVLTIPPNIFVWRSAVLCFSFVLCNLAGVVLELLRLDEICVPLLSFLVHVIRDLALPHDVLQHRIVFVLELFLRESVSHCEALLLRIFLGLDLRLVCLVLFSVCCSLLVLRSISDCAPISMFVSIHSTSSSLRGRVFDTRHLCSN